MDEKNNGVEEIGSEKARSTDHERDHLTDNVDKRFTVAFLKEVGDEVVAKRDKTDEKIRRKVKDLCFCCSSPAKCKRFLHSVLPVTSWLPSYNFKRDLVKDFFVGLTISVLHLPQGMAYGILSAVPAINGLYTSLFAPIFYFLFGTSKHISLGTMAVVALMTGAITEDIALRHYVPIIGNETTLSSGDNNVTFGSIDDDPAYVALKTRVATSATLLVGLLQFIMGVCRFGFIATYMSEALTRGFTTGCACYVFTAQIKYITGIRIRRSSGPFNLIYTHIELWRNIHKFNWPSFVLGISMILVLYSVKQYLSPYVKRKLWRTMPMPIPIDLLVIIFCTILSCSLNLAQYKVDIVGDIPRGLPMPSVPEIGYWPDFFMECLALAVVAYAIAISMAKIMAKRNNYRVKSNQELLALGMLNTGTSFFGCVPSSAAFSRTLLMDSMGAASQLSGIVSSCVILIVLIAVGPYFKPLPKCTLASIIMTALRSMFLQILDLPKLWTYAKYDFAIWVVTFLSTIILDVPYGLVVGIAFSLFTIALRSQRIKIKELGFLVETNSFEDVDVYGKARTTKGVRIFQLPSFLFYGNVERVRESLMKLAVGGDDGDGGGEKSAHAEEGDVAERDVVSEATTVAISDNVVFVMDMSAVSFCDAAGVAALETIVADLVRENYRVALAGCTANVIKTVLKSGSKIVPPEMMFLDLTEAIKRTNV